MPVSLYLHESRNMLMRTRGQTRLLCCIGGSGSGWREGLGGGATGRRQEERGATPTDS